MKKLFDQFMYSPLTFYQALVFVLGWIGLLCWMILFMITVFVALLLFGEYFVVENVLVGTFLIWLIASQLISIPWGITYNSLSVFIEIGFFKRKSFRFTNLAATVVLLITYLVGFYFFVRFITEFIYFYTNNLRGIYSAPAFWILMISWVIPIHIYLMIKRKSVFSFIEKYLKNLFIKQ